MTERMFIDAFQEPESKVKRFVRSFSYSFEESETYGHNSNELVSKNSDDESDHDFEHDDDDDSEIYFGSWLSNDRKKMSKSLDDLKRLQVR